jgi:hypothetical protein
MNRQLKRVFEIDRKMELRMRLAIKIAAEHSNGRPGQIDTKPFAREVLDRVIDRVRQL